MCIPFAVFKELIDQELNSQTASPAAEVAVGHFPPRGNKVAPVKIVEFSDFQCPFCIRFWQQTYPEIKKEYIDTNKAVFYYRHFLLPENVHPRALPYAVASECAQEQNKFWEFHDTIFNEQT